LPGAVGATWDLAPTTSSSTAIVPIQPAFTTAERLALAGFLAGYTGLTREAYALDLRQYATWCQLRDLRLFQARRADIECFARDLEAKGRARATITRRLCTIAGLGADRCRRLLVLPCRAGASASRLLGPGGEAIEVLDRALQPVDRYDGPLELCP